MSVEQARLFLEKMKTDEGFREKIMAVEDVAERIRLANAEGYDFTEDEIKTVLAESHEALHGVVGGIGQSREEDDTGCYLKRCKQYKR